MKKPSAEEREEKPEDYAKLVERVKELEDLREKFLRSAADYDNAKKRLAKEREEFIRYGQEKLLRDLLPILDNFERVLAHVNELEKGVAAGIELTWKHLLEILGAHGLKRFSSEGQPFDPHLHEAADQVIEEGPEGIVVQEIASGYKLHDRVLRPAKVKIRAAKPKAGEEKEEELT